MSNYVLIHHGIKGQKWGVRRFQNPDGTLTEAGKKRLLNGSGEKTYKTLKKQVRKKRAEEQGSSNRWRGVTPIGENSKRLIAERGQKEKEYKNSKAYKDWEKKYNDYERRAQKKHAEGKLDIDKYDEDVARLIEERPKKDFDSLYGGMVISRKAEGRRYVEDYLDRGGKDLSIAYLKDLGYNEKTSKQLVDKMIKSNRTLGMI